MIRVLVADDSPTVRELLSSILQEDGGVRVAGVARNGREAVELTRELRPDVITMDIHMPGVDGLEAIRQIMVEAPTPIIIVSSRVTEEAIGSSLDATRAGALMVMPTPSPGSPRFSDHARQLLDMVKAMAAVKVVRRHASRRSEASVATAPASRRSPVEVVAVAASTGGPAALHRILINLPRDFPVPMLVVQHISLNFVSGLCHWLDSHCDLQVKLAEHRQPLQPRTVYVAPDGHHLAARKPGVASLSTEPPVAGFRPSGTYLFESVANSYGPSSVAVVLTGMGSDGAAGVRAVHAAGGHVLIQDEATSVVYGMPGAAARTGAFDQILPLEEIAAALVNVTGGSHHDM